MMLQFRSTCLSIAELKMLEKRRKRGMLNGMKRSGNIGLTKVHRREQ